MSFGDTNKRKLSESDSDEDVDVKPGFGSRALSSQLLEGYGFNQNSSGLSDYAMNNSAHARTDDTSSSSGEERVVIKKQKPDISTLYNPTAQKMMAKMGYKEGTGLGLTGQGRVDIVESSMQRGRRGLGLQMKGLEARHDLEWDFTKDEVISNETANWIPSYEEAVPELNQMLSWKVKGPKKMNLDDETDFCSEKSLNAVLNSKSVFDILEPEEMRKARTRSNPYETIRGAFFLNRAAVKMANMDAVLDFMFTNPRDLRGHSVLRSDETYYFADICAGPGGFSEYVLWRRKGDAKGFGMTLRGENDFKLENFFAGPSEMFEPHYGVHGADGDGDIFNTENQNAFISFVKNNTENKGVHFVMADGGFSVEGQENIQEILSKQLYLCQFLVALSILREGGHFVCKLFDVFTRFSVGLVYLMYRAFHQVSVFKPVTSRPANSERYIICKHRRSDSDPVREYMHQINLNLNHFSSPSDDVTEIVPIQILQNDDAFFNYMVQSNEELANLQVVNLKKIQAFTQNTDLYDVRQSDVRKDCLAKWQLPDEVRKGPTKGNPVSVFDALIQNPDKEELLKAIPSTLTHSSLEKIHSVYDYRCTVSGSPDQWFILGLGRIQTYCMDCAHKKKWQKLEQDFKIRLELPRNTLLIVEIVQELRGEGKGQRRQTAIHVVDGLFLYDVDIRKLPFLERIDRLSRFVKALTKPTRTDLAPIRAPEVHRLEETDTILNGLEMRVMKGSSGHLCLCHKMKCGVYIQPTGLHIIKFINDPWTIAISRSTGKKYWYNTKHKTASYECPPDSTTSVRDCRLKSFYWAWEKGVKVHLSQNLQDDSKVSRDHILSHIQSKIVLPVRTSK